MSVLDRNARWDFRFDHTVSVSSAHILPPQMVRGSSPSHVIAHTVLVLLFNRLQFVHQAVKDGMLLETGIDGVS